MLRGSDETFNETDKAAVLVICTCGPAQGKGKETQAGGPDRVKERTKLQSTAKSCPEA